MIRNKSIRKGDEITIVRSVEETKTVTVTRDPGVYIIDTSDGSIANIAEGITSFWPEWEIIRVKHFEPEVEHLPCQDGDLWLAKDDREWFVFAIQGTNHLRAMTTPHSARDDSNLSREEFEKVHAKKLLHRRGSR